MLDIRTLLIVQAALMAIHGLAWLAVWRSQPRLPGLAHWTLSVGLNGIGIALLLLQGETPNVFYATAANVCFIGTYALMQFSHADLLRQPRQQNLALACVAIVLVLWPIFILNWPDRLGYRTTTNSALFAILSTGLAWTLLTAMALPRPMRWIFSGAWLIHALFSVVRGYTGRYTGPGDDELMDFSISHAVWVGENILATITASVMMGILIGVHLNRELRQRNRALIAEVAQRRQLQEQLAEALAQEAALRQEQHDFINRIALEFRAPLLRITKRADAVQTSTSGNMPNLGPRLSSITAAAHRLGGLIETFLLDRMHSEKLAEMPLEPVWLGPLLTELAQQRQPPGGPNRIQLQLSGLPLQVRGNPAMLGVAFGNLIDNALKYSPPESMVDIVMTGSRDEAHVAVIDRGMGIPQADLNAIGRRFFRASNVTGMPGTGLGLYGAGRLIQIHGGRFTVDSVTGKGTTVRVHLPLLSAAAEALVERRHGHVA